MPRGYPDFSRSNEFGSGSPRPTLAKIAQGWGTLKNQGVQIGSTRPRGKLHRASIGGHDVPSPIIVARQRSASERSRRSIGLFHRRAPAAVSPQPQPPRLYVLAPAGSG
jgi:hypothetical protein